MWILWRQRESRTCLPCKKASGREINDYAMEADRNEKNMVKVSGTGGLAAALLAAAPEAGRPRTWRMPLQMEC